MQRQTFFFGFIAMVIILVPYLAMAQAVTSASADIHMFVSNVVGNRSIRY